MLLKLIFIALGSGLGGICRFLLGKVIHPLFLPSFPWGTFVVNILGCLFIGIIYGFIDRGITLSENMRLFLTVGFCGGFTTFSTFMHENYLLFTTPQVFTVVIYAGLSVIIGLICVYLGYFITNQI